MTDVNSIFQIEMRGHRRQVVSVVIHVMAFVDLTGPAMSSTIMGDDAISVPEEEQHLGVPIVGRKRPAMAEHDGLAFAPVLVKDVDAVLGPNDTHFQLHS